MLPGERVAGRFEILGEAGRGGMGTVFRARDRRDRREVALKVLSAAALRNVPRFEQEAALLSGLRHPNIVEYVAHGSTPDGTHYLVMEWVDGENLAQRLDRTGLDARDTVALAIQIARALGAMHAHRIVHRDVKPSNLMLVGGRVDQVKLVDFGVARRTTEPGRLTRTGAMVGTAGYMAPEQVRGGKTDVDGRADLFALGCVIYECVTGQQAFVGETALAARAKVLVHDPPPVRVYAPSSPEPLDALVSSLLSRDVAARPADAAAVERALDAIGALPPGQPLGRRVEVADTVSSPTPTELQLCAVMVSWRTDVDADGETYERAIAKAANATVESIDGGMVMLFAGELDSAARMALELAAQFPRALIAVAVGDTIDRAIDDGARLVEQIEIDTVSAADEDIAGVWVDRATADLLGEGFRVVPAGDRVRVLGQL